MLAPITDVYTDLTLIANSGIQFLDFALTPDQHPLCSGKFVRQTANGPLLRLSYDASREKYLLPLASATPAEVVMPEFSFTLAQSLVLLNDLWLPLPFLRVNPPRTFTGGPDNWARVRIVALESPDAAGCSHRVCLAFDTKVSEDDNDAALGLNENDVKNGIGFTLAHHSAELGDFLDHTWVDGWLREVFTQRAADLEKRSPAAIGHALRAFEYQGHYLNILALLAQQLNIPALKISAVTLLQPAIAVDLILDVGNSHTCGIMVEDHPDDRQGLKHTRELQLRDLSAPHRVYSTLFDSRMTFAEAHFGKRNYSLESGRDNAFIWPSIARVGREATRLALQRLGTEGASGLSSPRRYLWDEERYAPGWRFGHCSVTPQPEPPAAALPFTFLLNDKGQPLYRLPQEDRLPVFAAQYSRSSLMSLMLCELLAQALLQMNSPHQRQKMPHSGAPRQLRTIILTLPSAMPKPERGIFRQRMEEAIALVWKALGWHPADDDFSSEQDRAKSCVPVPVVQMEWDEATCGQMVYLYNETQVNFGGCAAAFFASMARPDLARAADEPPGKTLRIASIDIGGGTTDLAITQYRLDDGVADNVKILPSLLFREGFKLAGDDILLDVIQRHVLPALQNALKQAGVKHPQALMARLFGDRGRLEGHTILRQQTVLQLFIPLGQAILTAAEISDPLDLTAEIAGSFAELLAQPLTDKLSGWLNHQIQRELPPEAAQFNVLQVPLIVRLSQLHADFLSPQMTISHALRAMCEVVARYDCDLLLLTGRPARFPGVQALFRHLQPLPVSRIMSLEGYHTSDWYPFNSRGRIENPKSTAAVGAMLCLLALDLRLDNFWFQAGNFQPYSTLRYLGVLDSSGELTSENVWYQDIDLDRPGYCLESKNRFQVRGAMTLGFRQLANARWPASALYTLTLVDPQLARSVAGNRVLHVRLAIDRSCGASAEGQFVIVQASLDDGSEVPLEQLRLSLNTLTGCGAGSRHYWIDSGSVYKNEIN